MIPTRTGDRKHCFHPVWNVGSTAPRHWLVLLSYAFLLLGLEKK